ncbi:hypothetical protein EOK75_00160 [Pseudorhodobacter turbinis]|uniref:Uncharacterized protein n=1 Tax=Pseudorhodobacter turbinis TaxID=2500533 RepID=A0A4P8ECK5_9RHOB|nr:hypothetical protein [Pseudorhodobacter turbinis]QCO54383.1 hypothetical protein EOK75_00160 [Pseudorhodobacter turbinis]
MAAVTATLKSFALVLSFSLKAANPLLERATASVAMSRGLLHGCSPLRFLHCWITLTHALSVSAAHLPSHAATDSYDGNTLMAERWIVICVYELKKVLHKPCGSAQRLFVTRAKCQADCDRQIGIGRLGQPMSCSDLGVSSFDLRL